MYCVLVWKQRRGGAFSNLLQHWSLNFKTTHRKDYPLSLTIHTMVTLFRSTAEEGIYLQLFLFSSCLSYAQQLCHCFLFCWFVYNFSNVWILNMFYCLSCKIFFSSSWVKRSSPELHHWMSSVYKITVMTHSHWYKVWKDAALWHLMFLCADDRLLCALHKPQTVDLLWHVSEEVVYLPFYKYDCIFQYQSA